MNYTERYKLPTPFLLDQLFEHFEVSIAGFRLHQQCAYGFSNSTKGMEKTWVITFFSGFP